MKCFFFRIWISHLLDGDAPAKGFLKNHLIRCPSCRSFYRTGLSLHSRLKADAGMEGWLKEVELRQRVMTSVRRQGRAPRPARRTAFAAACLALAAAAALIFLDPPAVERETGDLGMLLEKYLPAPERMQVTEPLSAEMDRLTADLESLGRFLGTVMSTVFADRGPEVNGSGF